MDDHRPETGYFPFGTSAGAGAATAPTKPTDLRARPSRSALSELDVKWLLGAFSTWEGVLEG